MEKPNLNLLFKFHDFLPRNNEDMKLLSLDQDPDNCKIKGIFKTKQFMKFVWWVENNFKAAET